MVDVQRPTIRSRRLGMQLRVLREERGLTLQQAARLLNRTASAISKLETGHRGIHRPSLENMLDRYELTDDEQRERLFALARDSGKKGWWQAYDMALLPALTDLISVEDDAGEIRSFEVNHVPGLLQTVGYTRAMLAGGVAPPSPSEVDRLVAIRTKRQQILTRPNPPRLWVIMTEAAVRHIVGGREVMRGQLRHLLEMARLNHVMLQVLPYTAGAHPGLDGAFIILEVGEQVGLTVVYVESLSRGWFIEDDQGIRKHQLAFDLICATALSAADSLALIKRVLSELE